MILTIQTGDQVSFLRECKPTWRRRLKLCWPMKWCRKGRDGTMSQVSFWVHTRDRVQGSASTQKAKPTCCQHSTSLPLAE
eukprot:2674860-Amphidinium_carterae.1